MMVAGAIRISDKFELDDDDDDSSEEEEEESDIDVVRKISTFDVSGSNSCDESRGAIHQLLNIILKLRILVLLTVSTLPYVVKVKNCS
jgi:hypothetical protein